MPRSPHFSKRLFALSFFAIVFLVLNITQHLPSNESTMTKRRHEMPASVASVHTDAEMPPSMNASRSTAPHDAADPLARRRASEAYGQLPISFEANEGQFDREVKYFSRANGISLFLTPTEAVLSLQKEKRRAKTQAEAERNRNEQPIKLERDVLRLKLVGSSPDARVAGVDEIAGKSNYFIGNNPANWHTNVAHYARVRYSNVYPGVDVVYYGNQNQLEYDLIVAPGAAPGAIKLAFDGARRMRVDADGALRLRMSGGELRQPKPFIYQEENGVRKEIQGRYVINEKREVGFEVAAYDASRPLVIDPIISYSTYLGGNRDDAGYDIALDSLGNAYITGSTNSDNFPSVNSLPRASGGYYSFITKLNVAGSALVYSTYIGGTGGSFNDHANSIAVDRAGNAYITGWTAKTDFPIVDAYQSARRGSSDAFVTKLNPSGSVLVYSTYLGGSVGGSGFGGGDEGRGISVDAAGSAYIVGRTESTDFPTLNALQPQHGGGACDNSQCYDAFITKFDPSGATLVYSTYLGGNKIEYGNGIALDSSGSVYVTGFTVSRNFPTTTGALQPAYSNTQINALDHDGFVAKLNPAGKDLVYSTYLGGSHGSDDANDIAIDSNGNAYVVGTTNAGNFPTANAFQPAIGPGGPGTGVPFNDAFVAKLNATGSALVYSTFLGGTNSEEAHAIAVDAEGHAYAVGSTNSPNFPVANAIQPKPGSPVDFYLSGDAFITKIKPTGSSLAYSTFLGGTGSETARGIAVDSSSSAYVTGYTTSTNFPTVNPYQATRNGGSFYGDAFITKIADTVAPVSLSLSAIQPNRGGNTGFVTVNLHGTAFANGATVKLVAAGQPDILAVLVKVNASGTVARVRFNLEGQSPGVRDVVITNPDGASATRAGAFTVEAGGSPQMWMDIVGRDAFRPGQPQTFYIHYGNRGNVDAVLLPIIFSMPKDAEYELGFNLMQPPKLHQSAPLDFSKIPPHVTQGTKKLLPLIIPFVPAGKSGVLKIRVTSHSSEDMNLSLYMSVPSVMPTTSASPPPGAHKRTTAQVCANSEDYQPGPFGVDSRIVECASSASNLIIERAIGIVPGADCILKMKDFAYDAMGQVINQGIDIGNETFDAYDGVSSSVQMSAALAPAAAECLGKELPGSAQIYDAIQLGLGIFDVASDCFPVIGAVFKSIKAWVSFDPNDKVGASGAGAARYIAGAEPLRYAIYFENKPEANAPAQEVVITDQLDPSKLDFDTFSLGSIGFGKDKLITPPSGLSEFSTDVDLRPQNNLIVRLHAKLDKATGLVTWRFTSIDPKTGLLTDDPLAGFLPPNKTAPEGEGQVLFTVQPKRGLSTGTEIRNRARIVFDTNAPIDTPEWLNTVDNSKPVSAVLPLPASSNSARFAVSWSGSDTGSGIRSYTIFVSEDGAPFVEWQRDTTLTSGTFAGRPGHTYAFHSIARDAAGNEETRHADADATITTAPLVLQFDAADYSVNEGAGGVRINVARTGNTTDAASVDYRTTDADTFTVGCADAVNNKGSAFARCDFATTVGTLSFDAGELSKTITVPLIDDGHDEGVETFQLQLSNAVGMGVIIGTQNVS
ncbi:MAG TPA: SBBP repeat-containing protein, partial [Pyrinomonadaceae bacterium]|nr:SBBP repeat-containing protein [Pyrinomonadaceae bacterium]